MPYEVFVSYCRDNRNDDLDRFVADLCAKIRLCKHLNEHEVAFFDGESIETGVPWKQQLAIGLRTSRVLLAFCSPDYINSDYCGKEFQVFLERYDAYVAGQPAGTLPNVILPILWGKPAASLREVISRFQYTDDDFPAIYAHEGLRYMMDLKAHEDDWKKLATRLAQKIVDASAAHPLPELAHLRPLDAVESAFHGAAQAEPDAGDRAWFVFVAPKPGELQPPRVSVDRYRKIGGRDWRPFHPDAKEPVGLIAQTAASQYDRYFEEAPLAPDLLPRLKAAEAAGEPVVILVDPWSLKLAGYRAMMKALDKQIVDTSGILISWNAPDDETAAHRAELETLVATTFSYRAKFGVGLHYWGAVECAADLRARLLEMLAHYTNRVLETTKATKTIAADQVLTETNDPGVPLARPPIVDNGTGAASGHP
jgi:FxsC-like protein